MARGVKPPRCRPQVAPVRELPDGNGVVPFRRNADSTLLDPELTEDRPSRLRFPVTEVTFRRWRSGLPPRPRRVRAARKRPARPSPMTRSATLPMRDSDHSQVVSRTAEGSEDPTSAKAPTSKLPPSTSAREGRGAATDLKSCLDSATKSLGEQSVHEEVPSPCCHRPEPK